MTTADWTPKAPGILDILPDEIVDFETQVQRFQNGLWNPNDFMAFRLRQGVYGQRQADSQMMRIKAPFGGIKDSGYGKEAGIDSIKDYTRVKTTWFYTSDEPSLDPFSIR